MRTRSASSALIPMMIALLLPGCGSGEGDTAAGPIKVGAIFDLTGPTSDVGTTYSQGLRHYVEWFNQQGGAAGRPIELLFQDYGYKVDMAEQLYSQFVQEGAVAFLGWGTGDTEALRGRIAADRIPFVSASYSHVLGNPQEAPYNFLIGTSYSDQFFILLDWILENHKDGAPRVALMHHASPYGLSPFEQGGRDYAASRGIELTAHEMPRGATDFTAQLTRISESGAGYVIFQNTSGPAAVALKNAHDLGLDLTFACLNWCTNEVLVELAGPAAEGVLGSILFAPPGEGVQGLEAAATFLAAKGSSIEEQGLLYGQGWWTMGIMAEAIRRAAQAGPVTGEAIKAAFETFESFETGGVTAPVTFTPQDHRGVKGMRIFRVEGGRFVPLTGLRTASS